MDKLELMLKGTLTEKFSRVNEVHSQIKEITEEGVRASSELDELFYERSELEMDIYRHQLNGEKLEDQLLDYCFRHFPGHDSSSDSDETYTTVFDKIPLVEKFLEEIENSQNQKILMVYGNNPRTTGIISSPCIFEENKTFRDLMVPTRKLLILNPKGQWEQEKRYNQETQKSEIANDMYVNKETFEYPSSFIIGPILEAIGLKKDKDPNHIWMTNHRGLTYIGGSAPEETTIYIGDSTVERGLRAHSTIESSNKRIKVQAPEY